MINDRLVHFETACREAGIKVTHQRREVFRELAGTEEHPDAETIYRNVKVRIPEISLDTVYRTLWLFSDLQIVSILGPRKGNVRFDANTTPHHHFVCLRCGMARDFEIPGLERIEAPETARRFGRVIAAHIEIQGICTACQEEKGVSSQLNS